MPLAGLLFDHTEYGAQLAAVIFYGGGHISRYDFGGVMIKPQQSGALGNLYYAESLISYNGEGVRYCGNLARVLTQIFICCVAHKCPAVYIFEP